MIHGGTFSPSKGSDGSLHVAMFTKTLTAQAITVTFPALRFGVGLPCDHGDIPACNLPLFLAAQSPFCVTVLCGHS